MAAQRYVIDYNNAKIYRSTDPDRGHTFQEAKRRLRHRLNGELEDARTRIRDLSKLRTDDIVGDTPKRIMMMSMYNR